MQAESKLWGYLSQFRGIAYNREKAPWPIQTFPVQDMQPCRQNALVSVCMALFATVPVAAASRADEAMASLGMWQLPSAPLLLAGMGCLVPLWDGQPIQSMSASLSGLAWDSLSSRHLLCITWHVPVPGSWESPTRLQGPWLLNCGLLVLFELPWTICPCLLTPGVVVETSGGWVWSTRYLQWHLKCVGQLNWPCGSCECFLGTNFYIMK